ncbi:ABC transporter substrate-binding protein [Streptomyces niger]|uniref:ABC transporter substrate-binding protein n=1 Tax=Streptomyces niger TaxID=66373 RepID=UPI00069BC17D|nr:ABC transporter substrate-binding protein [Streptomyces niger]
MPRAQWDAYDAGPGGSPLLAREDLAAVGGLPDPAAHTEAELATVLRLVSQVAPRTGTVAVGHSRDAASRTAADAFRTAWQEAGGEVVTVVDWPEEAASWLRPAQRLTADHPDAWVIAAAPLGWVQLSRRLRRSTDWDPGRTVGFAALADSRVPALAGPGTLAGLSGGAPDGGAWRVRLDCVTHFPATD